MYQPVFNLNTGWILGKVVDHVAHPINDQIELDRICEILNAPTSRIDRWLCKFGWHRTRWATDHRPGYGGVTAAIICVRCRKELKPPVVWPRPGEDIAPPAIATIPFYTTRAMERGILKQ
jgi:hypothetical protein